MALLCAVFQDYNIKLLCVRLSMFKTIYVYVYGNGKHVQPLQSFSCPLDNKTTYGSDYVQPDEQDYAIHTCLQCLCLPVCFALANKPCGAYAISRLAGHRVMLQAYMSWVDTRQAQPTSPSILSVVVQHMCAHMCSRVLDISLSSCKKAVKGADQTLHPTPGTRL